MSRFHEAEDEDHIVTPALTDTTTSPTASDSPTAPTGDDTLSGRGVDLSGNDTLTGGNDTLTGSDDQGGNDSLTAGGNDSVTGQAGNDSLTAGAGNDSLAHHDDHDHHLLTGTAGNDIFVVEDSTARNPQSVLHIVDFTSGQDQIDFGHDLGTVTVDNFATETADSYAAAFALARADIATGAPNVVAVQVGADVVVFADTHDNNHVSGAVVLVGKTLAGIAPGDII